MTTVRKIDPRRLLGVRIALDSGTRRKLGAKSGEKKAGALRSLRLGSKPGAKEGRKPEFASRPAEE